MPSPSADEETTADTAADTTEGPTTESPTIEVSISVGGSSATTTTAQPWTTTQENKVQIDIDEDASYVVESSIGMGLSEEEARAIEPSTQAALATTLAVSAEAVTITGYDVQGRRLE